MSQLLHSCFVFFLQKHITRVTHVAHPAAPVIMAFFPARRPGMIGRTRDCIKSRWTEDKRQRHYRIAIWQSDRIQWPLANARFSSVPQYYRSRATPISTPWSLSHSSYLTTSTCIHSSLCNTICTYYEQGFGGRRYDELGVRIQESSSYEFESRGGACRTT